MKTKQKLYTLIKTVIILLSFIATFKMPYEFYELFRYSVMVMFFILSYLEYEKKHNISAIIWFSLALLINPFAKLELSDYYWKIIDILLIIILILSFINKETINSIKKFSFTKRIKLGLILIIWLSIFIKIGIMKAPKTLNYYLDLGYSEWYAKEIVNSEKRITDKYLSIASFILAIGGTIVIIRKIKNDTK